MPRHGKGELLPSAGLAAFLTAAVLAAAFLTAAFLTAALRSLLGFLSGRIASIIGAGPLFQCGGHRLCHRSSLHQANFSDPLAGVSGTN